MKNFVFLTSLLLLLAGATGCTRDKDKACYSCLIVTDSIYRSPYHGGVVNRWVGDTLICNDTAEVVHLTNMRPYADSIERTFTDTAGLHSYWAVYRQRVECLH